jgi:hypothetical protein
VPLYASSGREVQNVDNVVGACLRATVCGEVSFSSRVGESRGRDVRPNDRSIQSELGACDLRTQRCIPYLPAARTYAYVPPTENALRAYTV